jgi:hypothetical protein
VFASKFLAEKFGKVSPKNLYLGSPKYDIEYDKAAVRAKYGIPEDKRVATIFLPNNTLPDGSSGKDIPIDIVTICQLLKMAGFFVVTKSRHNKYPEASRAADKDVDISQWWPHPSLELISVSSLAVLFNSTVNKECVMMGVPYIHFDVTDKSKTFGFLNGNKYCVEMSRLNEGLFKAEAIRLSTENLEDEFQSVRAKFLFEPGGVAKKILDKVL